MSDDKSKIVEVMPPDAEAIRIIVNELRDRCEVIIKHKDGTVCNHKKMCDDADIFPVDILGEEQDYG